MSLLDRLEVSRYAQLELTPLRVVPTSDARGFTHHVARWPLRPEHPATLLRPSILGGCFDHLHLPSASQLRSDLPLLGFELPDAEGPLLFLDIETTGLLGSGAFVFVVGIAYLEADELVVEQWTLRGVSAEDRMLAAVFERIGALGGALATFNGSTFDLPLLRRRARVNALDPAPLRGPHLDLLHVARRIWRGRQENCRLVTLERTHLDVHRVDDIDGHLIPDTFWEALRDPDDPANERRLTRVRMHNHGDVVSLAALVPALAAAIERPVGPSAALRGARHLAAIGDPEAALARLEPWLSPALSEGSESCPVALPVHPLALFGAELLRRRRRHGEAARLWQWVCTHFPGDPTASEGLAKHLEHRCRDVRGALRVAEASICPSFARIHRLQRKLRNFDGL